MKISKQDQEIINRIKAFTGEEEKTVLSVLKGLYTVNVIKNLLNHKEIEIPFIGKMDFDMEKFLIKGAVKKKVKIRFFNPSEVLMEDLETIETGGETQARKWMKESISKTVSGKVEIV